MLKEIEGKIRGENSDAARRVGNFRSQLRSLCADSGRGWIVESWAGWGLSAEYQKTSEHGSA